MNKTLFIIPARGGSKGITKKNIKLLNKKPLIYYTIDEARKLTNDENICLSTDSEEVLKLTELYGLKVPFIRPKELASDHSGTEEVIKHAIKYYENIGKFYNKVVLLQPTSPFRKSYHIKSAIELMEDDIDMVVSVKETNSNPYYVLFEENKNGFLEKSKSGDFIRRQDCPKVWEYNGAVYVISVSSLEKNSIINFKKIKKIEMDELSSIDIDSELDFKLAELITENERVKKNNLK